MTHQFLAPSRVNYCLLGLLLLLSAFAPPPAQAAPPQAGAQRATPQEAEVRHPVNRHLSEDAPDAAAEPLWPDGPPFVPSTPESIDRMLRMAGVEPADVVYDIGSGDGAIVIQAAKSYGVAGVGIEIDAELVRRAQARAVREQVDHLIEFRLQDAFAADISPATVVTLYMLPDFNAKFRRVMERQLKPGTRVVAQDYTVPGWVPYREESYRDQSGREHRIMLFKIR